MPLQRMYRFRVAGGLSITFFTVFKMFCHRVNAIFEGLCFKIVKKICKHNCCVHGYIVFLSLLCVFTHVIKGNSQKAIYIREITGNMNVCFLLTGDMNVSLSNTANFLFQQSLRDGSPLREQNEFWYIIHIYLMKQLTSIGTTE